jgi:hypothetical protein
LIVKIWSVEDAKRIELLSDYYGMALDAKKTPTGPAHTGPMGAKTGKM